MKLTIYVGKEQLRQTAIKAGLGLAGGLLLAKAVGEIRFRKRVRRIKRNMKRHYRHQED